MGTISRGFASLSIFVQTRMSLTCFLKLNLPKPRLLVRDSIFRNDTKTFFRDLIFWNRYRNLFSKTKKKVFLRPSWDWNFQITLTILGGVHNLGIFAYPWHLFGSFSQFLATFYLRPHFTKLKPRPPKNWQKSRNWEVSKPKCHTLIWYLGLGRLKILQLHRLFPKFGSEGHVDAPAWTLSIFPRPKNRLRCANLPAMKDQLMKITKGELAILPGILSRAPHIVDSCHSILRHLWWP